MSNDPVSAAQRCIIDNTLIHLNLCGKLKDLI